jgi:hypothetical protein
MMEGEKIKIVELLQSLANSLEPGDVTDFIAISQHYANGTPYSYRRVRSANIIPNLV